MNLISAASFILLVYSPAVLADVACTASRDCGIGGVCALSEVDVEASRICCNSGKIAHSSVGNVCTGLAAGKKCGGKNHVCASGVCGMDNLCKQEPLGDESPCRNNEQCASRKCARFEADTSAGQVCCTSGGSKYVSTILLSPRYVCTGLAAGKKCGESNHVCASKVCGLDNLCKQEPIEDESPCKNNDHCASKRCALSEADVAASHVCCTGGGSPHVAGIGKVCSERAAGQKCGGANNVCASGVCGMDNLCRQEPIEDESPCRNNDQCASKKCSRSEVDVEASHVCCTGGRFASVSVSGIGVCTGRAAGKKCGGTNLVCASGVCGMDKLCKQEPIEDGSPCRNNDQCASRRCARFEADVEAGHVCCTSGGSRQVSTLLLSPKYVCTGLAARKKCGGDNRVCASGVCGMDNLCKRRPIGHESPCRNHDHCASKTCALSEADVEASLVCCTSGDRESIPGIGYACTGRAAGKKCGGDNRVCASGVCGMDNLCRQEPIEDESPCRNDDQCASKKCARSEADVAAGHVCCTSGGSSRVWKLPFPYRDVCTDLASGTKCAEEDHVCRSGSCGSNELCTKQLAGSSCNGNNDDCENDACGQVEAVQGAEFICCPSGKTLTGGFGSLSVCTNIGEENQACFEDSICKSNVCVSGVCQGSKKWENEPCEKDAHCHSSQCKSQDSDGLGSCQPFASLAAKNDYINDSADCPLPLDQLVPPDANDVSSDSVTVSIRAEVGGAWGLNDAEFFMFGQEVLGGVDKCLGSFVAQRQGSQVCFSYQRGDKIGSGDEKFTCVTECTNVCKPGYNCRTDEFYKYNSGSWWGNEICGVTVKSEAKEAEAQADADGNSADADGNSGNGVYEPFDFEDMSSMEDIMLNGDPDAIEDMADWFNDLEAEVIKDMDPDASVNTLLNPFGSGNSSTRVIASVGISLFTAASIAFLFW